MSIDSGNHILCVVKNVEETGISNPGPLQTPDLQDGDAKQLPKWWDEIAVGQLNLPSFSNYLSTKG